MSAGSFPERKNLKKSRNIYSGLSRTIQVSVLIILWGSKKPMPANLSEFINENLSGFDIYILSIYKKKCNDKIIKIIVREGRS